MHPFIHPLQAAVDPAYESRNQIGRSSRPLPRSSRKSRRRSSGKETDVVALPILHDTPGEIAQDQVKDWKKGRMRPDPRQDSAELYPGRTRLHRALRSVRGARAVNGQARQWRQRHRLEHRARGSASSRLERRMGGWPRQGLCQDRVGYRRDRGRADAGARDQRRGGREGVGGVVKGYRSRSHPSGASEGRREDPVPTTLLRNRGRSSRRPHGQAWKAKRSATTRATRTSTS